MTLLGKTDPGDTKIFFAEMHRQWTTDLQEIDRILRLWDMPGALVGNRIATGEATEVYPIYERTGDNLLGYLRIGHRGSGMTTGTEITLMTACREAGLPTVELLHAMRTIPRNGEENPKAITFVEAAQGVNLLEALQADSYPRKDLLEVVRNAGINTARLHALSDTVPKVSEVVDAFVSSGQRSSIVSFYEQVLEYLHMLSDAQEYLMAVYSQLPQLEERLREIHAKYPLILIHSDTEPKHIFFDPETFEIVSLIDFGSAHVDSPHFDLLNWKSFAPETFDDYLNAFLEATFGDNRDAARTFVEELDVAEVAWQMDWAIYRMEQMLVSEAMGHMELCAQACKRISLLQDVHPETSISLGDRK